MPSTGRCTSGPADFVLTATPGKRRRFRNPDGLPNRAMQLPTLRAAANRQGIGWMKSMPNTPFQKEWNDVATRWGLRIETPSATHPDDDEALMEMLADWGWSGNGSPPAWYREPTS